MLPATGKGCTMSFCSIITAQSVSVLTGFVVTLIQILAVAVSWLVGLAMLFEPLLASLSVR